MSGPREDDVTSDVLAAERHKVVQFAWDLLTGAPVTHEAVRAGALEELFADVYTSDVVWDGAGVPDWLGETTYQGYDGVMRFFDDWFASFDSVVFELERLELRGDLALSVALQRAYFESGQVPVEWRLGYIHTLVGSKVARIRVFSDPEEAERVWEAETGGP